MLTEYFFIMLFKLLYIFLLLSFSYQIVDTVVGKIIFSAYNPPKSITILVSFDF